MIAFRLLSYLSVSLLLLCTSAASAQTMMYPQTGQRFAIMGKGEPTVIVMYGLASSMQEWMPTARRLAAQSQVFIYERRGYGRAPIVGSSRGSKVIVEELDQMLENLNLEGPYVLVGHSLGAIYAQAFARTYPEETAGILLVDPSVEQLDRFMMGEDDETLMPLMTVLMNRGAKAEYRGRRLAITERDEADEMPADIAVTVLSAGRNMRGGYSDLQEQVTNLQAMMTFESDLGRHIVVEGAGHNLHQVAPHAIELEVARLVALARAEETKDAEDED